MKKVVGLALGIAAAVLALVALIFYLGVSQSSSSVVPLLVIAIIVEAVSIITAGKLPDLLHDCFPIAKTVLIAAALASSFIPAVGQIAYVVSGLDPISTISSFITAASVMGAALLISIISGFFEN